jgi:hypothetical protein
MNNMKLLQNYILRDYIGRPLLGIAGRYVGQRPAYLFAIGAPSLISADKANRTHDPLYHREKWYERSASRKAKKYFSQYNVIWNEEENPTY